MKRTALTHTKMRRLQRQLTIPAYAAVGIMESLWNLTAREAPRGDIGKLSNEDIAMQLDWEGDPDELVRALLASGWLDIDEDLRFVVHDWHEHADDAVDNTLARSGQTYANGSIPRMRRLSAKERNELSATYSQFVRTEAHEMPQNATPCALPLPLPLPEPEPEPKKKQEPPQAAKKFDPGPDIRKEVWEAFEETRRRMRKPLTDYAKQLAVKKLLAFQAKGHDPNDILETTIVNGWMGFVEPKEQRNGGYQQSGRINRVDAQIAELRKAGVNIPHRVPEESTRQVRGPAGGSDGCGQAGLVLEGAV